MHQDSTLLNNVDYDVTLYDETGADFLRGEGQNLAYASSGTIYPRFAGVADGRNMAIPIIAPMRLMIDTGQDETYGVVEIFMYEEYRENAGAP